MRFFRRDKRSVTQGESQGNQGSRCFSLDERPADLGSDGRRSMLIKDLPAACFLDGRASLINGRISYQAADEDKLGLLKIGFHGHVDPSSLQGVDIELNSMCDLQIMIASSNSRVKIGKGAQGNWIIGLFREALVEIGDNVTCNGSIAMVDDGELIIGDDCMFANAFIHAGDNHAIFEIASGKPLNVRRARVEFETHVWVAARAAVIGDAIVGAGSVVAADATVKGDVPRCSLVAGVPARVVRRGVSWTRDATGRGWEAVARGLVEKGLI